MHSLTDAQARRTLEVVPVLLCHTDTQGAFTWLSPGWEQALGHPEDSLLGRICTEFVHPDDLSATIEALSVLNEGQTVNGFENRYKHTDGSIVWLRWHASMSDGQVIAAASVVTAECEQRQVLREQRDLLALSEEIAGVGHWRVELTTGQLHWSPQTFRIHGLAHTDPQPTMQEAVGFYHPDDRPQVDAYIRDSLESAEVFDFELRLVRADKAERIVRSRGIVERDELGKAMFLVGTFQDITEARMLQRRLQDSERLGSISLLAAGIAHEINNPLQYVFANIGLAQERLEQLRTGNASPWTRELSALLNDAMHGSKQVARIVGDLKAFMNNDPGAAPKPLDLIEVLKTTISMSRAEVRQRARLGESLGPLPKVMADYAEMIQVFVNLLTNAAHAVEPMGLERARIRISCCTDAHGWAIVEIEDNGPGVPKQDQHRIFEPFYTTKPLGIGSGLGLHISRSIVERRGGRIKVNSTPGLTIFQVRMPPAPGQAPEEVEQDSDLPKVLIVDDDARVARTVSRMLESTYQCVVETEPKVALVRVLTEHFDLVICDVMMPGMTGWELIQAASEQKPKLRDITLLMSGADPEKHRPLNAPLLPCLEKPFGPAELREHAQRLSRTAQPYSV
jgi:PAS domain S-box-containing protein